MAAGIGIGRFVYTPILPPMVEAVPLTKSAAGLIASANFVGYLAGALLASWPGLPGTRRFWLILGLATNALCLVAMGLTHSLALFLALRLAAGVASVVAVLVYALPYRLNIVLAIAAAVLAGMLMEETRRRLPGVRA